MKGKEGRFIKRGGCQRLYACHIITFQILFFCYKVIYRRFFKQQHIHTGLKNDYLHYISHSLYVNALSQIMQQRAGRDVGQRSSKNGHFWSKLSNFWPAGTMQYFPYGMCLGSLFFSRRGLSTYKGVVNFLELLENMKNWGCLILVDKWILEIFSNVLSFQKRNHDIIYTLDKNRLSSSPF